VSAASADAEPAEPEHGPGPTVQDGNCLAIAKGNPPASAPRRPTPDPELLGNWGLGHGPGPTVQNRNCWATAKGNPPATAPRRPAPESELLGNREGESASDRAQKAHPGTRIAWQPRRGTRQRPRPEGPPRNQNCLATGGQGTDPARLSRTGIAWQLRMGPGVSAASADAEPAEPEHRPGPTFQNRNCLATAKGNPPATAPRRPAPNRNCLATAQKGGPGGNFVPARPSRCVARGQAP